MYNAIFGRINYLISEKSDAKYSINHNFARIRIDSYNSLPIEKKKDFSYCYNTKNKNNYYYNIFL